MSFDPKLPCRTRDGREVKILETDGPGIWRIFGRVRNNGSDWMAQMWTADGHWMNSSDDSRSDLINIPREFSVTRFFVIATDGDGTYVQGHHAIKPSVEALKRAGVDLFAIVPQTITAKEGEGL